MNINKFSNPTDEYVFISKDEPNDPYIKQIKDFSTELISLRNGNEEVQLRKVSLDGTDLVIRCHYEKGKLTYVELFGRKQR